MRPMGALGAKRGQASIEFLVYAVAFTLALSAAFVMITSLSLSHVALSQRALGVAVAERVANALTLMATTPEGSYYRLTLPPTIGKQNYTVRVLDLGSNGQFVEVSFGGESVLALFHGRVEWSCADSKDLLLVRKEDAVEVVCR